MPQHTSLTLERWSSFSFDQQILMIANELNRARKLGAPEDRARLQSTYERALHLTDLTIQIAPRRAARRELLRWRDLVASLYGGYGGEPLVEALRALLLFTPNVSRQITELGLSDTIR